MEDEIKIWRNYFLDDKFSRSMKYIPDVYKTYLINCFLSIPSLNFSNPEKEWENCLSVLFQNIDKVKDDK